MFDIMPNVYGLSIWFQQQILQTRAMREIGAGALMQTTTPNAIYSSSKWAPPNGIEL